MGNQKQKKGNGVLPLVLGLALILLGAAVYLLPKVTNALYEHKIQNQKEAFLAETPVVNPDGEAGEETEPALSPVLQELYDCLQKENERLFENHQDRLTDPFAYEQVAVDLSRYGLRDNIIGYITIEKMNVVLPILIGATVDNMRVGAAILTGFKPMILKPENGVLFWLGIANLAFVPFYFGMYRMWDPNTTVDGANDNLTACLMGIAILKAMKDEGIELEHTEVGVILSGSEEAGLRGAKAWCEQHKG